MIWKRTLLSLALMIFLFLTLRAIQAHSYMGVIMISSANPGTQLLSIDLILSLVLVSIWMVFDARKNRRSYIPFLLITALFGVAGPLLYLLLRDFSPKVQRLEATLVFLGLLSYSALAYPLADLRVVTAEKGEVAREKHGRELMLKTANSLGLTQWQKHKTITIEARDLWKGNSWWPELEQGLKLHLLRGTFTSQAELVDGQALGERWGIQAWIPYRQMNEAMAAQPVTNPAPEITFYLPTLHYFAELPFRLLQADHLFYEGQASYQGKAYELVLATWGETQPNQKYDQYQLWINSETQRIDMVHYTVRDVTSMLKGLQQKMMKSLAIGTIHFEDYRKVDGVWFPFTHTVTLQPPKLTRYPLERHYFHRLEIQAIHLDAVSEASLLPLQILQNPSNKKPQNMVKVLGG